MAKTVYRHFALFESRTNGHQKLGYYVISVCPGDAAPAELVPALATNCWHTAARQGNGTPLYSDGEYSLEVTAWDSHENYASESMRVTVDNSGKLRITAKEPAAQRAQAATK